MGRLDLIAYSNLSAPKIHDEMGDNCLAILLSKPISRYFLTIRSGTRFDSVHGTCSIKTEMYTTDTTLDEGKIRRLVLSLHAMRFFNRGCC